MSNRDALRKLGKLLPGPPEFKRIFDNLRTTHDRSAAIIGAALVDSLLEQTIVKHLRYTNPDLMGQLFGNKGPLSDFHSKIVVATAFGVISNNTGEELHRIKAVRNVFAHAKLEVTFDTEEITKETNAFRMIEAMREVSKGDETPLTSNSKTRFLICARLLCIILDFQQRERGGTPLMEYD